MRTTFNSDDCVEWHHPDCPGHAPTSGPVGTVSFANSRFVWVDFDDPLECWAGGPSPNYFFEAFLDGRERIVFAADYEREVTLDPDVEDAQHLQRY